MARNRFQAINAFWSQFGLVAYPETAVDGEAQLPYITYSSAVGEFEQVVPLSASLWYYSSSWKEASEKAEEIAAAIGRYMVMPIDGGYMVVTKGQIFAQQMEDPNDSIKRMYLQVLAEFCSEA
jgi:hypothetical protein